MLSAIQRIVNALLSPQATRLTDSMTPSIVGIVLVKNEDLHIEQVLCNIQLFCDKIIIADHLSSDGTADTVNRLCNRFDNITYHRIKDPSESHELVSGYADTATWIFAVDGDELYDPAGLSILREKIFAGEFDKWWMLLGNVLHCTEYSRKEGHAQGYLTPPCRSMTKLYNFSKIDYWKGPCPERLHGGDISFKDGYSMANRLLLYDTMDWETSFFRCLHFCFMTRSSKDGDRGGQAFIRKNISDINSESIYRKFLNILPFRPGRDKKPYYKREMYMRGPLVRKATESFFSDPG